MWKKEQCQTHDPVECIKMCRMHKSCQSVDDRISYSLEGWNFVKDVGSLVTIKKSFGNQLSTAE